MNNLLYSTSLQKVLYFLLLHPDEKFYDREVSRLSRVSRAAANYSLRSLTDAGLVEREKRGRMYFYYADLSDPVIRQLKITQNILYIKPLADKIKNLSLKIVLYGSCATGTNHAQSDMVLFVLSAEPEKVKKMIYKSSFRGKVQCAINSPQDFAGLKKENPVFCKEVSNGIVLYEAKG